MSFCILPSQLSCGRKFLVSLGSCHVESSFFASWKKVFSVCCKEGLFAPIPSPPRSGGSCHVRSLIVTSQLGKKVFSVGVKGGLFAPLTSAPRTRGSYHVGSSLLNLRKENLVSIARKIASLHSPPLRGADGHVMLDRHFSTFFESV